MKTKDEILEEVGERHSAQEYEVSWNMALEAMEIYAEQQVKNLNIPAVIKSLPEYNEILYHARTLSDEQFREYWNEIQGNVL